MGRVWFGTARCGSIAVVVAGALLGACTVVKEPPPPPITAEAVGEVRAGTGILNGYLKPEQVPDSLALLPPPPDPKSARFKADGEAFRMAPGEGDAARWALASSDADLAHPTQSFAAILGITIDPETMPNLTMLLRRSLTDAGLATYRAKNHYSRVRPFVMEKTHTCYPSAEEMARSDGSYPSGHSSIGWALALIFTELAPDKANALLQRGYDFGQSRVVCRYHWQSDVDAGRVVAAAVYARLQADPVFRQQLALARAELATARGAAPQ